MNILNPNRSAGNAFGAHCSAPARVGFHVETPIFGGVISDQWSVDGSQWQNQMSFVNPQTLWYAIVNPTPGDAFRLIFADSDNAIGIWSVDVEATDNFVCGFVPYDNKNQAIRVSTIIVGTLITPPTLSYDFAFYDVAIDSIQIKTQF